MNKMKILEKNMLKTGAISSQEDIENVFRVSIGDIMKKNAPLLIIRGSDVRELITFNSLGTNPNTFVFLGIKNIGREKHDKKQV